MDEGRIGPYERGRSVMRLECGTQIRPATAKPPLEETGRSGEPMGEGAYSRCQSSEPPGRVEAASLFDGGQTNLYAYAGNDPVNSIPVTTRATGPFRSSRRSVDVELRTTLGLALCVLLGFEARHRLSSRSAARIHTDGRLTRT